MQDLPLILRGNLKEEEQATRTAVPLQTQQGAAALALLFVVDA